MTITCSIHRLCGQGIQEDERFTKPIHKMIAGAYATRDESLTDPAGVNFNVSNLIVHESNEMTSSLRNIPNMLLRRNNITDRNTNDNGKCPTRSCSCDSVCSICYGSSCESEMIRIQTVSVECESRRTSIDSTVSVKMSETEVKVMSNTMSKRHRKKKRQQQPGMANTRKRKDSSSSGSEIVHSFRNKFRSKNHLRHTKSYSANAMKNPKTNRRGACTDIDIHAIKTLLKQQSTQSRRNADEDEVSIASVQVHRAMSHFVATRDQNANEESTDSSDSAEMNEHTDMMSKLMFMNNGAVFSKNKMNSAYRNVAESFDMSIRSEGHDVTPQASRNNNNGRNATHFTHTDDEENDDPIKNRKPNSALRKCAIENESEKLRKLLLP